MEICNSLEAVLGSLKELECSGKFGLGTHLQWEEEWIIKYVSDSTICMEFYTVANLLQGGADNLDVHVSGAAEINHADCSDELSKYVMFGIGKPDDMSAVNADILSEICTELMHFYSVDPRISGKYLVRKILIFLLYNCVEILSEDNCEIGSCELTDADEW